MFILFHNFYPDFFYFPRKIIYFPRKIIYFPRKTFFFRFSEYKPGVTQQLWSYLLQYMWSIHSTLFIYTVYSVQVKYMLLITFSLTPIHSAKKKIIYTVQEGVHVLCFVFSDSDTLNKTKFIYVHWTGESLCNLFCILWHRYTEQN